MSDEKTNQDVTVKQENSDDEDKASKDQSQDSESASDNPQPAAHKDTKHIDLPAIKGVKDASASKATEKLLEKSPARHPKLPPRTPPRYFVDKSGGLYFKIKQGLRPMKPSAGRISCMCLLQTDFKKRSFFDLAKIMAYTFSEKELDSDKFYVFRKDGDQSNCAWDNLIVCDDLPTLQQLEIARLEKEHPDTKYTTVKNIHDTLTFERYLVSDKGDIYSLITRRYLKRLPDDTEYERVHMRPGNRPCGPGTKGYTALVHCVVLQSFTERPDGDFQVSHINGDKLDNSLSNLEYSTRSDLVRRAIKKEREEARKKPKEDGDTSKKQVARPSLPPITDETRWKPIGVLPWNGRSFSQHEVSDMGHVRKIGASKLLNQRLSINGYATVSIRHSADANGVEPCARSYTMHVARLVANAFLDGYSQERDIVVHLNGDRTDSRAQNLKWCGSETSSRSSRSRRVKASLLDDPATQKEFPSIAEARRRLSVPIASRKLKSGDSVKKDVSWDGEQRAALIEIL